MRFSLGFSLSLSLLRPHDTTGLKEALCILGMGYRSFTGAHCHYLHMERWKPLQDGFPSDGGWITVVGMG